MKVLVFDTETTNVLPKYASLMKKYVEKYPYIVQLSFLLYDTETKEFLEENDIVINIPDHIELTEESTKIHGITREIMKQKGVDSLSALKRFKSCYEKCDIVVAHNIKFDNIMLIVECMRNDIPAIIQVKDHQKCYCTMSKAVDLCNIIIETETGSYKKFPKQIELHSKLFNEKINETNLHNSFNDIMLCIRCYVKMEHQEDILQTSKQFKKYFENLT